MMGKANYTSRLLLRRRIGQLGVLARTRGIEVEEKRNWELGGWSLYFETRIDI